MTGLLIALGLRGRAVPVHNGYTFVDQCPRCACESKFREVEVRRGFVLFELPGAGSLRFRCDGCGYMPPEPPRRRRRRVPSANAPD